MISVIVKKKGLYGGQLSLQLLPNCHAAHAVRDSAMRSYQRSILHSACRMRSLLWILLHADVSIAAFCCRSHSSPEEHNWSSRTAMAISI